MNRLKKHLNDKRGEVFADLVTSTFSNDRKNIEPQRSTRDMSVREMRKYPPHRIHHRFPIPGGISTADMLRESITASNALWERLAATKASDEQEQG